MPVKTDFKAKILSHLKEHANETLSRKAIMEEFGISNSRLSEILNSIRADGYTVNTPNRSGIVQFVMEQDEQILLPVTDKDLREWLLLYILANHGPLTFKEIVKTLVLQNDPNLDVLFYDYQKTGFDDASIIRYLNDRHLEQFGEEMPDDIVSVTTLRKDLTDMRNEGLIKLKSSGTFKENTYLLSPNAPVIIQSGESKLEKFCETYKSTKTGWSHSAPLVSAYEKASYAIQAENRDRTARSFGHSNLISPKQISAFSRLNSYPYDEKVLKLTTHNDHTFEYAIGLVFYSSETDLFYALGLNLSTDKVHIQRLDVIKEIETIAKDNPEFHAPQYSEMLDEMFATGFDDPPIRVKVLVSDFGNVKNTFEKLKRVRKKASLRPVNTKPQDPEFIYDYVYEDTIRGMEDFARFLRGFGYAVLAVEPPELVNRMKRTAENKLNLYGVENIDE